MIRHSSNSLDFLITGLVLSALGGALVGIDIVLGWLLVVGGSVPATIGMIAVGVRVGVEDAERRRTS